ncbi:MAG: SpoIIE family protein phosphatase [Deltaproteobacteria bacterium]|nr:SpoIIE family protein phosphatase [Deltaproteobacteria bacterium]
MASALEALLVRQLRRAGIESEMDAPTGEAWSRFLRAVNEQYRRAEEDRALLERTSELAAAEVNEVKQRMHSQRDVLRITLSTVANAIGEFGRIAGAEAGDVGVPSLESAKESTSQELEKLFGETIVQQDSSGELSGVRANLVRLADELGRLLGEMAEKATIRRELDAARALQNVLLPPEEAQQDAFVDIAGASRPTDACGGDFWAVEELGERRKLILVGDVTGHGIASAIIAGAAKAASHLACTMADGVVTANGVLAAMNRAIHAAAKRQVMMTCSAGVIDPSARTLTLANAGHHFAYLVRSGVARPLVVQGPPLGSAPTADYECASFSLQSGDVLVWFTDGVIECENAFGEQFTEKRLRAVCQRLSKEGSVATRDGILEVLATFRGQAKQTDDVTVVAAAIK